MEGYGPSCDTDLKLECFILGPGLADQIRTHVQYGPMFNTDREASKTVFRL